VPLNNLTVTGSNGAVVTNTGTWFDDPGTNLNLTASVGAVTRNANGTWSWSFTTPTVGAVSQAVTITGDDGSGYKAFATFYLNPTVRTVSYTNDSGAGSLRQAIRDTNADTNGVDEIVFAFSGTGPFVIQPATQLDTIARPVFINGYSQTGSSPNTNSVATNGQSSDNANRPVTLDGTQLAAVSGPYSLVITAGNSTVTGLVIQNFGGPNGGGAIHLMTNGNDVIQGNCLTQDGAAFGGPGGIFVDNVPNNTIGGTTPGARNLAGCGVEIQSSGATGNLV
jgi:hypothetical protein